MTAKKKPKNAPSQEEITAFSELVRRVQLNDIQLLCAEVHGQREFVGAHGAVDGAIEVALNIESKGSLVETPPSIRCDVMIQWQGFSPGGQEPLVRVKETYLVCYDLSDNASVSQEMLKVLAENNATFNVWPFFRQSLHGTTLRMGLPAYSLPLLKPMAND